MSRAWWPLLTALVGGCADSKTEARESGLSPDDSDADADADTDSDADSDADADTDSELALLTLEGSALVAFSYEGTEQVLLIAQGGLGKLLCEIRYPVHSLAPRDDCLACTWAFDCEFGEAEPIVSEGCAAAGYDAGAIDAISGARRSMGLALEYAGHAHTLMVFDGVHWEAAAFADWVESKGEVTYSWDQGYFFRK